MRQAGRRRVRRGHSRCGGQGAGGQVVQCHHRHAVAALRHRQPHAVHWRQCRLRRGSARWLLRGNLDAQCGSRALPCQGRGREHAFQLCPLDACGCGGTTQAGAFAAPGDRQRGTGAELPAGGERAQRDRGQLRGAAALEQRGTWFREPCQVHSSGGRHPADRPHRRMGSARSLPRGGALAGRYQGSGQRLGRAAAGAELRLHRCSRTGRKRASRASPGGGSDRKRVPARRTHRAPGAGGDHGAGLFHRARRFRHRLFLSRLPAHAALLHHQGGPQLRSGRLARKPGKPGDHPSGGGHGAQP